MKRYQGIHGMAITDAELGDYVRYEDARLVCEENERLRTLLRSVQVNAVVPDELMADIEHAIGEAPTDDRK